MTLKTRLVDLVVATFAGLISTLIINDLGIIGPLIQNVWPTFPFPYLAVWAAIFLVVACIGYWLSGVIRGKFLRRRLRNEVMNFLGLWVELFKAHGTGEQQEITNKLVILYPQISWYIRMSSRLSYKPPFSDTYIPDYDFIGNFLGSGPTSMGYTFEEAWDKGRKLLLAALGSLGYTP